jgi:hypothetical protein
MRIRNLEKACAKKGKNTVLAFAELGLTTWLPRRKPQERTTLQEKNRRASAEIRFTLAASSRTTDEALGKIYVLP